MNTATRTCALMLALGSLAAGCGSDAESSGAPLDAGEPPLDATFDGGLRDAARDGAGEPLVDAAVDSGSGDAGGQHDDLDAGTTPDAAVDSGTGDAGVQACTTYTPAKLPTLCGGSHCQQSPEKLRADTPTSAVCGSNDEVTAFCSLKAIDTVGNCAISAFGDRAGTKACAAPKLPELREPCLQCYLDAVDCTKDKCFTTCLAGLATPACDQCRAREGCIGTFYKCAGFINPLPTN